MVLLALMIGCQGLAGRWQGTLLCPGRQTSLEGQAELLLWREGGGELSGELRAEGEAASTAGREPMLAAWELELERGAPSGRQELEADLRACSLYLSGELAEEGCEDAQGSWTWDGAGALGMEGERCGLALERG
jgi:hypothetical protein